MKYDNKQQLLEDWAGGVERNETSSDGQIIMTRSDDFRTPQYLLNVFSEIEKRYRKGESVTDIQTAYGTMNNGAIVMDSTVKKFDVKSKRGWTAPGVFMYSYISDICQFLRESEEVTKLF
jgi:hypothetical protein